MSTAPANNNNVQVLWDAGTLAIFIFLFFYFSDFILIFFFFGQ